MSRSPLEIVFVCTGNRFRSPLAEGLLRASVAGLPVSVRSYGTLEEEGEPVLPEALWHAERFGVDISAHRSSSLAKARLAAADLVIGFETIHVAKAVSEAGAARERAFTLPELILCLELIETPRVDGFLEYARAMIRDAGGLQRPQSVPEIGDPFGGPRRGFGEAAGRIRDLVAVLTEKLFPATSRVEPETEPRRESSRAR
jgi:protein-tyrosine phosphatase